MSYPIIIESAGGEYMETVLIVEWACKPGDFVKAGETIVTVETAKAATEIAAPHDGYLTDILYAIGSEAPVGSILGVINDTPQITVAAGEAVIAEATTTSAAQAATQAKGDRITASPLARRLARQAGIELADIPGTGPKGRIKKRDVEAVQRSWPAIASPLTAATQAPLSRAHTVSASAPEILRTTAKPIVFLHGFGADRSAWRGVVPLLDGKNPVVTLDLPGHGASASVPARSIEDIAFAVSDELEAMGIEEAHVVGHSLGGATALALCQLGRLHIRSLCLIAPAGLGPEINNAFLTGITQASRPESLTPWLQIMVGDPSILPDGFARMVLRQRDRTGGSDRQLQLARDIFPDGTQSLDFQQALKTLRVPVKILWGKKDIVIPSKHALRAPGAVALHLIEGIGHVPQMECPDLVARLISELVNSAS